jgi:hypothetical protein|tara:strand:- start:408 stop:746 length:339 start_codon:yes stop_codon:yes gene_type:complete
MAQDFERYLQQNISNSSGSPTTLRAAADSDDAIIGIRCANTSGVAVNVTVYVENSSTTYHIIKNAPIPSGGSLELIDGGSKVVLQTGDAVKAYASAATSVDVITSVVDTISA